MNNAGRGPIAAVEEASDEAARAVFDTNVFGVLATLRAALPTLRVSSELEQWRSVALSTDVTDPSA